MGLPPAALLLPLPDGRPAPRELPAVLEVHVVVGVLLLVLAAHHDVRRRLDRLYPRRCLVARGAHVVTQDGPRYPLLHLRLSLVTSTPLLRAEIPLSWPNLT
jgi:hypothetical protein